MKQRRTLLKGIGLSLPAVWGTPVVQSVVLPAHAQTSTDNPTSEINSSGCPDLIIPGTSISCPVMVSGSVGTQFRVDENGECPIVTEAIDFELTPPEDVLQVEVEQNGSSFFNNVGISVRTNDERASRNTTDCGLTPNSMGTSPYTFNFQGSSGNPWQAEFTLSIANSTVSLSDILLTPAP
ncbi:MAG: hypothetical protein U5R46_16560 [Gammaproteobacteria bacterium]|nr:hypothetical protein [Gammaproteobacteria bacterium]